MKKSRKITLIVLTCIASFLLVAFAVLFMLTPVFAKAPYGAMLGDMFKSIGNLFALPFVGGATGLQVVFAIIGLAISGIWLVTLILGIVIACLKKRFKYLIFIPVLVFALFAALSLLALSRSIYAPMITSGEAGNIILGVFYLFLAIVGFVVTYITYILGLAWSGRSEAVEEAAIAPVAEQSADPEIVEEGEELTAPVAEEPAVIAEPVEESAAAAEPAPEEEPKVEKEPENNAGNGLDQNSLASLLREVVRDIVRDEIARNNANQPEKPQQTQAGNQSITGATFGGPLVVQYFNGGINGVTPANGTPAPAAQEAKVEEPKAEPAPEKKPEPVKEEPKPEPAPAPEVKSEPAPLFVKKPEEPGKPEAPKYERIGFAERLLKSDAELHDLYNELKNEILSYGVKSRISAVGDTFRLHKKMYVRITVAGKSLKLYFALDPKDYEGSTIPVQDASGKDMYAEIPLVFKVKSGLSVRRCKELIQTVMEKDNLEQGEIGKVNWVKELKAEMAADKKKEKEEE